MRPGSQVYVQTRGTTRAADYAFLCGAPPRPWWRAYGNATAFDHPTVLVASTGADWAAYLSGIPSARVDAVGTVVRYTLVLEGPCDDRSVADRVPAAVATWLDDVAGGLAGRPGRLSAALDTRFPPDDVQRWIDTDAPIPPACDLTPLSEPGRRVLDALASLDPPADAEDLPGDWCGAAGAPAARAAFVARVAALVGGARGRALLLNLVGGPDDLAELRDPASPLAVLVESTARGLARPVPLRPVVEAKKAPAPRAAAAAVGIAVLPLVVLVGMLATTALVVTLLFLLL